MATVSTPAGQAGQRSPAGEQRLVLRGIDWSTYRKLSDALEGRHLRFTYDRGTLAFGTVSMMRARCSRLTGQLICVLTEEVGLPILSCGDMTCDREDLDCAVEPDECFYIQNAAVMRKRDELDLRLDPPPDLAVEVDVGHDSPRRLRVLAAIGVPEVWRFDGETMTMHRRGPDGQYAVAERSDHFPFVSGADLAGFLRQRTRVDDNTLMRSFREWVRAQLGRVA